MSSLAIAHPDRSSLARIAFFADNDIHSTAEAARGLFPEFYQAPKSTFGGATSEIFALVGLVSTEQKRVLSKDEEFIQRKKLQPAINNAYRCIKQVFGTEVPTDLEYCSEHGIQFIEWIDINLHFSPKNDEEIVELLEKVSQLDELFESVAGAEYVGLINFIPEMK